MSLIQGKAPIKTAVIGFGLAGKVFHAPFVNAVPGLHLTYIVQRTGNEAAQAYPEAKILRSFEDALASDADLIVIGTPNETHYELAARALIAGKHIVVDKPVAATSDEVLALAKLAKQNSLVFAPFHNRRWDGDFLTIKALLLQKALGRVSTFESHFDRFRPIPRPGTWKESSHPANGMLFDLGPHLVDQALALFGSPSHIAASVRTDRDTSAIEDAFDIALHYPRMMAYCRATMIAADPSPRFHLHGTSGSFRKYGLDPQEPALVAGAKVPRLPENGKPTDNWLTEDPNLWGVLTLAPDPADPRKLNTHEVETEPGDYRGFYANVRDAIRGTASLAVTPEAAYRTIKLLELARQSSETGHTLAADFSSFVV